MKPVLPAACRLQPAVFSHFSAEPACGSGFSAPGFLLIVPQDLLDLLQKLPVIPRAHIREGAQQTAGAEDAVSRQIQNQRIPPVGNLCPLLFDRPAALRRRSLQAVPDAIDPRTALIRRGFKSVLHLVNPRKVLRLMLRMGNPLRLHAASDFLLPFRPGQSAPTLSDALIVVPPMASERPSLTTRSD